MYLIDEKLSSGNEKEDIVQEISMKSLDELLQESFTLEGKQVEKELQNEGRRF